jgi:preprotein translocase subunit SecA
MHLRGRAGRQGDPGEAKFFVSFEDELIKAAVGAKQAAFWSRHSPEGEHIARVSATITSAQASMAVNETAHLVRARGYDQVLAGQRHLIYADRASALRVEDLSDRVRVLIDEVTRAQDGEAAVEDAQERYRRREAELGTAVIRELERRVVLACLDRGWREHLQAMPELLNGIAIRMAGDAALTEYRREGTLAFNRMREAVNREIVDVLFNLRVDLDPESAD